MVTGTADRHSRPAPLLLPVTHGHPQIFQLLQPAATSILHIKALLVGDKAAVSTRTIDTAAAMVLLPMLDIVSSVTENVLPYALAGAW